MPLLLFSLVPMIINRRQLPLPFALAITGFGLLLTITVGTIGTGVTLDRPSKQITKWWRLLFFRIPAKKLSAETSKVYCFQDASFGVGESHRTVRFDRVTLESVTLRKCKLGHGEAYARDLAGRLGLELETEPARVASLAQRVNRSQQSANKKFLWVLLVLVPVIYMLATGQL